MQTLKDHRQWLKKASIISTSLHLELCRCLELDSRILVAITTMPQVIIESRIIPIAETAAILQ
jgi:hypothetical protein